jgi:hypothetical protein
MLRRTTLQGNVVLGDLVAPLGVADGSQLCGGAVWRRDTRCGCAWSTKHGPALHILDIRIPFTRMWTNWTTTSQASV